MSEIKISIILPSYNSEKHIQKAINSFLEQDYENKELIIVDGKSTDSTHEIIQKYISSHNSIKWVKEKDFNVTDAINIGIKYCTGDFYAFLAADVFYYSNDIFSTIDRNYKMVPFDGIYFDYYCYLIGDKTIWLNKCLNLQFNKYNLLRHGTIAGFDNIFISSKIYEKHQYDPNFNLCSDWEFFLRIVNENPLFLYVEKIATVNVQDGNNLSIKFQDEQAGQIRAVAKKYNDINVIPYFESLQPSSLSSKVLRVFKKILSFVFR